MTSKPNTSRGFLIFLSEQLKDAGNDRQLRKQIINEAAKIITVDRTRLGDFLEFCQKMFQEVPD